MGKSKRFLGPIGAGLLGSAALGGVYIGLISWAESPAHAWAQFQEDAIYIIPILLGFGLQVGLYVVLRWRLFLPRSQAAPSTALAGASGGTSTAAMVACCAHHLTDVLPFVGLTAAAGVLAQYQDIFMGVGLAMTLLGNAYMLRVVWRERRRAMPTSTASAEGARA